MTLLPSLLACVGADDSGKESAEPEGGWAVVGQGLDVALLDVAGTSATDVYMVGADAGAGGTVVHCDGASWSRLDGFGEGDLWWVHLVDGVAWIAGAAGRVFRYDPASGDVQAEVVDATRTLYGIWGPADGDLWAVGGNDDVGGAGLWHRTGGAWAPVEIPASLADRTALFKVWGRSASDVFVVGSAGALLHYDGTSWTVDDSDVAYGASVVTVTGDDTDVYAVGGDIAGVLLHQVSGVWANETPLYAMQLAGVSVRGGVPVVAGYGGAVYDWDSTAWTQDMSARDATYQDLHATWTDPDGGVWAVGGHLASLPLIQGVAIYRGAATIPTLEGI